MKKIQQTIIAKLIVTPHVANEFKATMREFANACNMIAEIGFQKKIHRRYDLHHAVYNLIRQQTTLPSQHVINAIAKVSEQLARQPDKLHKFKQLSTVRFDLRTLTLKKDFHEATLTVCPKGRVSGELQMSNKMRTRIKELKFGSADLVFRNGEFFLHITGNEPVPKPATPKGSTGVDFGVKRIAVTSKNKFYTKKSVKHKKRLFQKTRSGLQSNGSRRAKRVLKRLSGRERRFMRDVNHCISKQIVADAKRDGTAIILEDLKGIRERASPYMTKHLHGWSFKELRSMIEYKALRAGEMVFAVSPAYTSQGCHRCLHIGSRPTQSLFLCEYCGVRINADINGARSVAVRHDLMATGRYFCTLEQKDVSRPKVASPDSGKLLALAMG